MGKIPKKPVKLKERRDDNLKAIFESNTRQSSFADFPPPLEETLNYIKRKEEKTRDA